MILDQVKYRWIGFVLCVLLLNSLSCIRQEEKLSNLESAFTINYPDVGNGIWRDSEHPARYLLFLPLFSWDERGNTTGWLVEGWDISEDNRTWTYRLFNNILWHDGVAVTANDIEFTFDLFSHPDVGRIDPDAFAFKVIDDYTFAVTYFDKILDPLDNTRVYFPKHLLEDQDPSKFVEWDFWDGPVGNGPYRVSLGHFPQTVYLEANPKYYRDQPEIERVILRSGDNPLSDLRKGDADVVWSEHSDPSLFKLGEDPDFRVYFKATDPFVLYWNHNSPLFDDPNVRIALTMAIDRRELYNINHIPDEFPVLDGPVTDMQLRRREIPESTPYLLEMTDLLLTEAGWEVRKDKGFRYRAERPFTFTVITTKVLRPAALFILEELKKIGVSMKIDILDDDLLGKRWRSGDFEAAIWEGIDFNKLNTWLIKDRSVDSNIGYRNPILTSFLKEYGAGILPGGIENLNRRIWPLLHADAPFTFLHPGLQMTLTHRRIKGLSSPFRIRPERHMEFLRIDE
ncbi:ABC transporter substrate-binding protein [Acidobacteriota bacterium]